MKLKEFKKVLNKIPTIYDDVEVSFICNHKEYLVKDVENDIEWYENDMQDNRKHVDITLEKITKNIKLEVTIMSDKFFKTYIRIDTPSYYNEYPNEVGFATEEQKQKYDKAVEELIKKLALVEEKHMTYSTWASGKNTQIYFHPQNITGVMTEEESLRIAKAVNESDVFQVRKKNDGTMWIDRYDEYLDITEEEYTTIINEKKQEVRKLYLELCKTPRKHLFKSIGNVQSLIFDKVQVKTLKEYEEPLYSLLSTVFHELVEEKLLIVEKELVRTIQKSELKELKKKLLV